MEDLEVMHLDAWKNEFTEDECNFDKVEEYLEFIKVAVARYDPDRYSEWHHVMPRCVDKDKKYYDQGYRINGADHFEAHKRLVGCFNGRLKSKMQLSAFRMVPQEIKYKECTGEDFESTRVFASEALSEINSGEGNPFYGKQHTLETKQKISYAKSHPSDEARKNNSEGQKRRMSDPTNHPMYGRQHTEESKQKMREAHLNMSDETRKRMSESAKGNHAHLGCHHSEETRRILSLKSKGHIPPNKGKRKATDSEGNVKYFYPNEILPEGYVWRRSEVSYE